MTNSPQFGRRKRAALERQRREATSKFMQERTAVLRSLSPEVMIAFLIKWKRPVPEVWGTKPDAALAIMHIARLETPGYVFTYDEKLRSAFWLVAHQYRLPQGYALKDGMLIDAGARNRPK